MHADTVPRLAGRDWLAAAVLAGITFAAFAGALGCDFVNYDDETYVTKNPHVTAGLSGHAARWALTAFYASNWHPLTWLSLQLDATLWGVNPRGFHLTNVLLHAANAALAFLALRSLTGAFWRSLAAALLFAVHPLRVESVAWVAERKDVLSVCFGLAALWSYAAYAHRRSAGRYLVVAGLFGLSLLAKPTLVTLPFLLLVLDWWPLGRWQRGAVWPLLREKLPLLALAAASCVVTLRAQAGEGAVMDLQSYPPGLRVVNAVAGYFNYLEKTVRPANLAVFYPHAAYTGETESARTMVGAPVVLLITTLAIAFRRFVPYLLVGWLWYVGTLVPVIGLVQVGAQAYADRYSYFPQLGLLLALCWGAADLARGRERLALATAAAAALALAVTTGRQLRVWQDSESLWEHALGVSGDNPIGLVNLGLALEGKGRAAAAAERYRRAIELDRKAVKPHVSLGNLLLAQGKFREAEVEFSAVCALEPESPVGYTNLGRVYFDEHRWDDAAHLFTAACNRATDNKEVLYLNLGEVAEERHDFGAAAGYYRKALDLRPDFAEARAGLGVALVRLGRREEGLRELREAVRQDPEFLQGHVLLAQVLSAVGEHAEAARHRDTAARIEADRRRAAAQRRR